MTAWSVVRNVVLIAAAMSVVVVGPYHLPCWRGPHLAYLPGRWRWLQW